MRYNESFTIRMRGELNRSALQESIQQLVDRHDALRITFDPKRGSLPLSGNASQIEMPLIDLCSLAAEQREPLVDRS